MKREQEKLTEEQRERIVHDAEKLIDAGQHL